MAKARKLDALIRYAASLVRVLQIMGHIECALNKLTSFTTSNYEHYTKEVLHKVILTVLVVRHQLERR
jgi:hypothetical protein